MINSLSILKSVVIASMCSLLISESSFAQGMSFIRTNTSYDKIKTSLQDLAKQYPNNAKLITVGDSDSGDTIMGLVVGTGETNHLLVATHHGNEYGSTAVAMAFAKAVAANPIPNVTMHIIPVLNIKGYNNLNRYESTLSGKTVDPNRDYPSPCNSGEPTHQLKSTKNLANYIALNNIVGSATLHTYSPAVAYPWGLGADDLSTGYDNEFIRISKIATRKSGYAVGNSTELLYPVTGAFEDYAFWKHGIWSLLFELGTSHSPSTSSIQQMIDDNVPAMIEMYASINTTRAPNHDLSSQCTKRSLVRLLDRHDE